MGVARALLVATALCSGSAILTSPADPGTRVGLLIAAFGFLGVLVWCEHGQPMLATRDVLVASSAVALVAVARPPYGSHDLWSYAMYGRIFVHYHRNPYEQLPAAFAGDPLLRHVARGWRHTGSMYGPGFTVLSAAIVGVTRSSMLATRLAFQLLSAGAFVFCCVTLARVGAPRWAVIGIALNPLLLVTIVNGGHVDPVIAALLLVAALAADRQRLLVAALALGAAVSIKLVVVLPAAALLVWVLRHRGRRAAAVAGAVALGPSAAGVLAFGGRKSLRPLVAGSHQYTRASMWALLRHLPVLEHHVSVAALAVVAVVAVALVVDRLDAPSSVDALAVGAVAYVVAAAYVLPWYLIWALPLAAVSTRRRLVLMLLAYTAALALAFAFRPADIVTELGVLVATAWVLARGAAALGWPPRLHPNT